MYKLFALFCLCLTVGSVYSAVAILPRQEPPAKYQGQEGCYNEDLDIMLPVNETYSPDDDCSCLGYLCQSNGDTQIMSCGVIAAPPNCTFEEDLSLPYPACCKKPVCP